MKPTKLYCVILNEGHKANPDQITGSTFKYLKCSSSGKIAEYTKGEALKKANAFGGSIELTREFRCFFISIHEINGENEYMHKSIHQLALKHDEKDYAEKYGKFIHRNSNPSIFIEVCEVREISFEDYQVLENYL